MSIRALILSSSLLLAVPLLARDKTDVLVMKNGDRMTCEIKGLDAGILYVSFDYIDGTASVDWSKVARLESTQLFIVKTQDGSMYTGGLATPGSAADRPVRIQVVETPEEEVMVDSTQVVQMVQTSENFWQRFSGEISLGVIYSKGNQSTQYSWARRPHTCGNAGMPRPISVRPLFQYRHESFHTEVAWAQRPPPAALEQLVLLGHRKLPGKLRAGNQSAEHPRWWDRTLLEEHKPSQHRIARWRCLARDTLSAHPCSPGIAKCCFRPHRGRRQAF